MSHFKNSKPKIVVAALLALTGIAILIPHIYKWNEDRAFLKVWKGDFNRLIDSSQGHPGLKDIKSVKLIVTDPSLEDLYNKSEIVKVTDQGKFILEVFIDNIEEDGGLVIQYDLVETSTGNTVWEDGHTYSKLTL